MLSISLYANATPTYLTFLLKCDINIIITLYCFPANKGFYLYVLICFVYMSVSFEDTVTQELTEVLSASDGVAERNDEIRGKYRGRYDCIGNVMIHN